MARTLVAYYSRTGNTRLVAEAIYAEIPGEKALKPIAEVEDAASYETIFVGFPVQSHTVPYPVEVFLKKIPAGKRVALFSTHGSVSGSTLATEAVEYASLLVSKARIVGTFTCRGKVSLDALEIFMRSAEHAAWAEMAASAATHPDAHDLAEARVFARAVMAQQEEGPFSEF